MTCGIYLLYWSIDTPYIGQSVNTSLRKAKHLSEIKTGTHCNSKILAQYRLFNRMPTFEVLEECTSKELNYLEEFYIKEFDSINSGMNITSGGDSVGKGINNPKSKYTAEQLSKVFELLVDPNRGFQDISNITGVNRSTINQIANGHQHIWLQETFPDTFLQIKENQSKRTSIVQTVQYKGTLYPKLLSPFGDTVSITTNLDTFCKQHSLHNPKMYSLIRGEIENYRGWKILIE